MLRIHRFSLASVSSWFSVFSWSYWLTSLQCPWSITKDLGHAFDIANSFCTKRLVAIRSSILIHRFSSVIIKQTVSVTALNIHTNREATIEDYCVSTGFLLCRSVRGSWLSTRFICLHLCSFIITQTVSAAILYISLRLMIKSCNRIWYFMWNMLSPF